MNRICSQVHFICRQINSFSTKSNKSTSQKQSHLQYGSYAYSPKTQVGSNLDQKDLDKTAQSIYQWAKGKGAKHYSFIAYPHTSGICEKQESFISFKFQKGKANSKAGSLKISEQFIGKTLIKGEGDGSSFPSGGLRHTHTARGYTIWDPLSQPYIRRKYNTLYIPSLLISHQGFALDDKTLFRQSQSILKKNTTQLLQKLKVKSKSIQILLGLQQQFFVIPKSSFDQRDDLRLLGRALVGNVPIRNQQLGQHYYGKIPEKIVVVLDEIEKELIEMGIPLKTRHNEVALNQFEICSICTQAGKSIDQNMITMQVIKQAFQKHDLKVLLHQKPFRDINGSGKHANWSLNYIKQDGSLKNLFSISQKDSAEDIDIFKLFILINLMAIQKNHKLVMSAIATPGNQIRLGGHEAPPRIISVYLGTALTNFLQGKQTLSPKNLREVIQFLNYDVYQQNTDRNRTSPYAYTGNRFQFRALGSSQNPSFAMAVITATMAQEVKEVTRRLQLGENVQSIIKEYTEKSRTIRFEGNGYSKEWRQEAKQRGLYVNENFTDIYSMMENQQKIFEQLKICQKQQITSRANTVTSNYSQTVLIELSTLLLIADKHIIPQGYKYLQCITSTSGGEYIQRESKEFQKSFQKMLGAIYKLRQEKGKKAESLQDFQQLRNKVEQASILVTEFIQKLPHQKENTFPDLHQFLKM